MHPFQMLDISPPIFILCQICFIFGNLKQYLSINSEELSVETLSKIVKSQSLI